MISVFRKQILIDALPIEFPILLQSDIHVLSPHSRIDVVEKELRLARKLGARININGDLFDLILPSDLKRFVPSAVGSSEDDLIDVALKEAVKIYSPYADLIDVVGMGNHEDAALKHHSTNLIKRFVEAINEKGGQAFYGGFAGYIVYDFRYRNMQNSGSYTIRYHHGSGGASIVTRGAIDFTRMAAWISDADMIWMGHKHFQRADRFAQERLTAGGNVYEHEVEGIMTGGYLSQMHKADSYATKKNLQHLPIGGAFATIKVNGNENGKGKRLKCKMDTLKWSA
jgi:hypothetical protein